jgi:hypothetical protein
MRCLSRCADTSMIFKQTLTLPVYCVRILRYGRKILASGWNAKGWRRNWEPNRDDPAHETNLTFRRAVGHRKH